MAGQGETCTHVAAVLFYLKAICRMQGVETCTQKECGWLVPSYMKTVQYQAVKDIDFTSACGKKRKFDEMIEDDSLQSSFDETTSSQGCPPTDSEMGELFEKLSLTGTKPAILSLVAPYSDKYVPKSSLDVFPKPLKCLQQPSYLQLPYHELLRICETVSIEVTDKMAKSLESETRSQSKCSLSFKHRAGRVTASCMKQVCHTDVTNPAQSLVKSICYPQELSFSRKQTDWGLKHKKVARELYLKAQKQHHNDLIVADSGLVINPQWPFVAATPDGIVDCKCCGKGVLEIKCPYSHRDESVESAASKDEKFCLKKDDEGSLHLDHGHSYYYQVQTQLFVCSVDYCDFCVCTFATTKDGDFPPYIEHIVRDNKSWETCIMKAKQFFATCLLPEVLENWYTRPAVTSADVCCSTQNFVTSSQEQQVYCYCHGPEEGTMIACDNKACTIEWFHKKCLKMKSVPLGKWYCPDCTKLPQFLKGKAKVKLRNSNVFNYCYFTILLLCMYTL